MKTKLPAIVALLLICTAFCPALLGRTFDEDFSVVMIDDATEAKLGPFPYDRSVLAQGIQACARLHAKAVVLKFFLDLPRSEKGDEELAISLSKIPVALQASLGSDGSSLRPLPAKFKYGPSSVPAIASDNRGIIPLPRLLDAATKVGFVDFPRSNNSRTQDIPLVEVYQGAAYPSLILSCLELATSETATSREPGRISLGSNYLLVDSMNVHRARLPDPATVRTISFASLVSGEIAESEIHGKVVVIGLETRRGPTVTSKRGTVSRTIGLHRYFVLCLAAAHRDLTESAGAPRNDEVSP